MPSNSKKIINWSVGRKRIAIDFGGVTIIVSESAVGNSSRVNEEDSRCFNTTAQRAVYK